MNELVILDERKLFDKQFKMYGTLAEPLFLAKDVAEWLEHSDTSTMMRNVAEDEKLIQTIFVSGQKRDVWLLTEYGLYEVLMQSRKPIAKQFKSAIKEIIKSIRLNGYYYLPKTKTAEYWNTLPEDSTEFQIMLEQERGRIARRECRRRARSLAEAEYEAELHRLDRERIVDYLIDKERVCIAEIWYECMEKIAPLKKYDSNKIANIIISIDGWNRSNIVSRFKKYGRQRAFIKGGVTV